MALSACGHEAEVGDGEYHISHDLDMKFDNCFVCHTGGPFPAGGESPYRADHDAYPIEMCSSPACHPGEPRTPDPDPDPDPTPDPDPDPTPDPDPDPTPDPDPDPTPDPDPDPPGEPTAEDAMPITSHPDGPGYDNLCMICHMLGGTDPVPDDGYHVDYDDAECYDCHEVDY